MACSVFPIEAVSCRRGIWKMRRQRATDGHSCVLPGSQWREKRRHPWRSFPGVFGNCLCNDALRVSGSSTVSVWMANKWLQYCWSMLIRYVPDGHAVPLSNPRITWWPTTRYLGAPLYTSKATGGHALWNNDLSVWLEVWKWWLEVQAVARSKRLNKFPPLAICWSFVHCWRQNNCKLTNHMTSAFKLCEMVK